MARRSTTLEPGQSTEVEAYLNEKGVDYTFLGEVHPLDFNRDKSLRNQARVNTLDEETVERYVAAMERGDQFPAVLAWRDGKQLITIDGNHRLTAAERAKKTLYVYEVKADPSTIVMMTFEANTKHGLPTSRQERIQQAIYLIQNGATQKEAAQRLNLEPSAVSQAWTAVQNTDRAIRVGLTAREWDQLNAAVKRKLGTIATDEGFRAAAELALKARLSGGEIDDLVGRLKDNRSSSGQVAIVKGAEGQYRERIQQTAGGVVGVRRRRNAKWAYNSFASQVLDDQRHIDDVVAEYHDSEKKEAAQRMRTASARLGELAKRLERG